MISIKKLCIFLFFYFPVITVTIISAFWIYLGSENLDNLIKLDEAVKLPFDYIIIGGGTAGCVLANRLSENEDIRVLLIEAGGMFGPLSMIPLLASQQQKTQADWQLRTTPQQYSSYGFTDQTQFLPRGKGLGGSSQLNYLLHLDLNKKDLERWKENGANDWSQKDFLFALNEIDDVIDCYFDNDDSENEQGEVLGDFKESADTCSVHREKKKKSLAGSLLNLATTPLTHDYSKLSEAFEDASNQLKRKNNFLQYYLARYNTLRGLRHSVYHSYLRPAFCRSNLKILINTRVHHIKFVNRIAFSVILSEDNFSYPPREIRAQREVILSAGAFHSPQILKLSGIGPRNELLHHKISIVHNSNSVGENLYDHLNLPLYVTVNASMSVTRSKIFDWNTFLNFLIHGTGIFTNFGVIGYLVTDNDDSGTGIFGMGTIDERLKKVVNYEKEIFEKNFPFYKITNQEGFVLLNTCNQPVSRGNVQLYSNTIQYPPKINPNYLQSQKDIDCMLRSIRLSLQLIGTKPFRSVNATIHWPEFRQCSNFGPPKNSKVLPSDRYLECIIRMASVTTHHPGGSCAISNHSSGVLDSKMKVRGVKNLRVVDASVLPTPISGTPHASIVAVAEYAAKTILKEF